MNSDLSGFPDSEEKEHTDEGFWAEEVGRATTASVVASIFYIIVTDCVFSIIFYVLI